MGTPAKWRVETYTADGTGNLKYGRSVYTTPEGAEYAVRELNRKKTADIVIMRRDPRARLDDLD